MSKSPPPPDPVPKFLTILEMAPCHNPQRYEWLPFNREVETVPTNESPRKY